MVSVNAVYRYGKLRICKCHQLRCLLFHILTSGCLRVEGLSWLFSVVNNSLLITELCELHTWEPQFDLSRVVANRASTGFETTRKCVRRNEAIVIEAVEWEMVLLLTVRKRN